MLRWESTSEDHVVPKAEDTYLVIMSNFVLPAIL